MAGSVPSLAMTSATRLMPLTAAILPAKPSIMAARKATGTAQVPTWEPTSVSSAASSAASAVEDGKPTTKA